MQLIVGISLVAGAFSFGPERLRHHPPSLGQRIRSRGFSRMATSIPQVRSEKYPCVGTRGNPVVSPDFKRFVLPTDLDHRAVWAYQQQYLGLHVHTQTPCNVRRILDSLARRLSAVDGIMFCAPCKFSL